MGTVVGLSGWPTQYQIHPPGTRPFRFFVHPTPPYLIALHSVHVVKRWMVHCIVYIGFAMDFMLGYQVGNVVNGVCMVCAIYRVLKMHSRQEVMGFVRRFFNLKG